MATKLFRPTFQSPDGVLLSLIVVVIASSYLAFASSIHTPGSTSVSPGPQPVPVSIKNAPFSAEVSTEYDHLLANGNHIHRETRGRVARDSQGRVRTETEISSPLRVDVNSDNIAVLDPVQHVVIHLDARTKVARIFHLTGSGSVSVITSDGPIPSKSSALLVAPQNAGANAFLPRSDVKPNIEPLGMKMVEGVRAVGTRTSRNVTNPRGELITAVTEVWFSTELQMVLLSISDDGEAGRSVMRLTNIRRMPPNQELFRVPPEYTVKETNPIATASGH